MSLKRNLLLAAAFVISAQSAFALTAAELAATLAADGYSYIQIKTGTTQIKTEAVKDGQKVETIYNAATGAVLKTEIYTIGTIVSADPGVQMRDTSRDFVRVAEDGSVLPGGGGGRGRGRGFDDRPAHAHDDANDNSAEDHGQGRSRQDQGRDDQGREDNGREDNGGDDDHGGAGRGRG